MIRRSKINQFIPRKAECREYPKVVEHSQRKYQKWTLSIKKSTINSTLFYKAMIPKVERTKTTSNMSSVKSIKSKQNFMQSMREKKARNLNRWSTSERWKTNQ